MPFRKGDSVLNSTVKAFIIRAVTVILIISISVGFGFAFDAVCTAIEKGNYPRPEAYTEFVRKYSEKYGVPEQIVYAVIKAESDFQSDAVSSMGAVGLMQLMPSVFEWLSRDMLGESLNAEMLYSPETNIKYGTYYLSYLYNEYGIWDTCFAAYNCGPGNVNKWLSDSDNIDENGILIKIPNSETAAYVERVNRALEMYNGLYYEK